MYSRDDESVLQQLLQQQLGSVLARAQCSFDIRVAMFPSASKTRLYQPRAALGQELVDGLRTTAGRAALAGRGHLSVSVVRARGYKEMDGMGAC